VLALFVCSLTVAAVFLTAELGTSSDTSPTPPESRASTGAPFPPDDAALKEIRFLALRIAAATGDPDPTSGRVYVGTRRLANNVASFGTDSDSDQRVYLIILEGEFEASSLPLPGGAPVPTGSIETIIWDPTKDVVTDFGVKDRAPDTTQLGAGVDLGL